MSADAQRLIGLSLTKIAQSRMSRNGISLHKNLLVATVLQKARFIFMEEAYGLAAAAASEAAATAAVPAPESPRRVSKRRRESVEELAEDGGSKRLAPELSAPEPMEVERITSLVSVFSFGGGSSGRLERCASSPDLCAAPAHELAVAV